MDHCICWYPGREEEKVFDDFEGVSPESESVLKEVIYKVRLYSSIPISRYCLYSFLILFFDLIFIVCINFLD